MAGKYNRYTIGSIVKSKTGGSDSICLRGDMKEQILKSLANPDSKGRVYWRLETIDEARAQLDQKLKEGKLSPEYVARQKEFLDKTPDFVVANIVFTEPKAS